MAGEEEPRESYEHLEMRERSLKDRIAKEEDELRPLKSGRLHLDIKPNAEKTKREIAQREKSIASLKAQLKEVQRRLDG